MSTTEYNESGFDKGLVALLGQLRASPVLKKPSDDLLARITDDMPDAVKALLHAIAHHGGGLDLGDYEFVSPTAPGTMLEDADGSEDLDLDNALLIARSAGGEDSLIVGWQSDDSSYEVYCWSVGENELHGWGTFTEAFEVLEEIRREYLEDADDEDEGWPEDLEAILRAADLWQGS